MKESLEISVGLGSTGEVEEIVRERVNDLEFMVYEYQRHSSVQFSSVAKLCPTLCDSMNCSTPGLLVHD